MKLKRGVLIDLLSNGVRAGGFCLARGKVLAYRAGTTTPVPLWKTIDKSLPWDGPWGNEVALDAEGRAEAYGDGHYRFVLCDADGNAVETWEPLFFGHEVVSARDFGALGAGEASVSTDTHALQEAIDYCVANAARLFIPAGTYLLTRSLQIHKLIKNDLDGPKCFSPCGVEILGERSAAGIQGNDTVLVATFADRPALVMQGVSGVVLSRLTFEGQNNYALTGDFDELCDDRTFVVPGCRDGDIRQPPSLKNAVCSPYAAIAVDPYPGGGPPPDGGYPGHENHYYRNGLPSRSISIEQCSFYRFVVGVVIAPAGADLPPEDVRISDSTFEHNKVSVAVGFGKSQNLVLRNLRSFGNLFFVSTLSYGAGDAFGEVPSIRGATVSATKHLFNLDAGCAPAVIEGLSCDSTLGMGFIRASGPPSSRSLTFVGCTFDFAETERSIDTHLFATANLRFVGCSFATSSHALPIRFANFGHLSFSSCSFLNITADVDSTAVAAQVPFAGFEDLGRVTFEESSAVDRSVPDQLCRLERVYKTAHFSSLDRCWIPPGSMIVASDLGGVVVRVSSEIREIPLHGVTIRIDPEFPGEATFFAPAQGMLKPGDLVFAESPGFFPESYGDPRLSRGVIGVVEAIEGSRVLLGAVAASLGPGVYDLRVRYLPRLHLPCQGLVRAGSDVIVEVSNAGTFRQFDRISGQGIPPGTFVADPVLPGATRLQLSRPATVSSGRPVRLYDADVERFGDPPFDSRSRGEFEAPPSTARPGRLSRIELAS
ncbi:MAG: hypothetical protein U0359_06550 [Byssovorax sp.]